MLLIILLIFLGVAIAGIVMFYESNRATLQFKSNPLPTSSTTVLGPNEIHWADAIKLIDDCQVTSIVYSAGPRVALIITKDRTAENPLHVVENPSYDTMRAVADQVSSTCGYIKGSVISY